MTPGKILAAFIIASGAAGAAGAAPVLDAEGRFRRGDANHDGAVDISDAVAVFSYLFLGTDNLPCLDAADANDDGTADISDGIAVLGFLFQGEPPPPFPGPGPCPGSDPTPDALDCAAGEPEPEDRPGAAAWPEPAHAAALRQRRGAPLPFRDGAYRVGEGISFVIVVEAAAGPLSRAEVPLADPASPGAGDPRHLQVSCDRDLGDPARGGVPAGANLAPVFLSAIDLWSDPVFLIQRACLRIDGRSAMAPAPGRYRFRARVIDAACAASPKAAFDLEVEASGEPEIHLWLEGDAGGEPAGPPRPASAATGGLMLDPLEAAHLIVEGIPGGGGGGAAAIDPASFRFAADPPILPGTAAGEEIAPRFRFDGIAGGGSARWRLRLDPAAAGQPAPGNLRLEARLASAGGDPAAPSAHTLEVAVSYAAGIQPLWNRDCSGCHERPQPQKGLELVAPGMPPARLHRNIVNVFAAEPAIDSSAPLLIRPYHPERSYLIHKLRGTHLGPPVLGSGDRMPQGGPPFLDPASIRLIEDWTAQGARNN